MQMSDKGLAELVGHEAIVPYPYRDSVGVWTFGIGHTKAAGPPDPMLLPHGVKRPIEEVFSLFRKDIASYETTVSRLVKVEMAQHEFDALVSFNYNTGGLRGSHILTALNAGDRAAATKGFDSWHIPASITERRDKEKKLFERGVYSNEGMATVYPADASGKVLWSQGKRIDVMPYLAGPTSTEIVHP